MSNIADKILTAQDKDGMLRRALERIIQLYTDRSHFIYELLQNAEDAQAKSIRFVQYADRLEVFHDGKPFTAENLTGLCDIGKSDKIENLNQIGEFGVGFKSVFGICKTVRLYSAPDHFREKAVNGAVPFAVEIRDFIHPADIPEEDMPGVYTTHFVFPYAVGYTFSGFTSVADLNDAVSNKLQHLGFTTLLFMKNLERIEYQIETGSKPIKGEYFLGKTYINDDCMLVTARGTAARQKANEGTDEITTYLKFSQNIDRNSPRTVDIAFPIHIEKDGSYQCVKAPCPYVSVYFPTETESKLDFIVQGPYRTTPNRSSIPAIDADNKELAQKTAKLLRQSIISLKLMGKLNMSFLKVLPLTREQFAAYDLFLPLYDELRDLFLTTPILPAKSGRYVYAKEAVVARGERLTTVFSDDLLTELINDSRRHCWLPAFLTEDSKEYAHVRKYVTSVLNVPVMQPDRLRSYITANPGFLPARPNAWLIELYGIFEDIPGSFTKARDGKTFFTTAIVKASNGEFVAPYRREEDTYIQNVFPPKEGIHSTEVYFVDPVLYSSCRSFFDGTLQLQPPKEYDILMRNIESRYSSDRFFDIEQHANDVRLLIKYANNDEYKDNADLIIKKVLKLLCADGKMRSAYEFNIFLQSTPDGINIEEYYRNIKQNVVFINQEFYASHGITASNLLTLRVCGSVLTGEATPCGTSTFNPRGRLSRWRTDGAFRWKLSIDSLREALWYISAHQTAKDSLIKSQVIMKLLLQNEARLCGRVYVESNGSQDLEDEPCEMVHVLRGDTAMRWDGKWLFTEAGELVSPKEISKHDLSTAIYGKIDPDSVIFKLLGFKKTDADEVEELKKTVSRDKLNAFFESELKQRYGITTEDLNAQYGMVERRNAVTMEEPLPFPVYNIRSWDALKKHATEMLFLADPVLYEEKARSIRVSNNPQAVKAYLRDMYRQEGSNKFKYSCQLCHDVCGNFVTTEIFLKPDKELEPMNLCLCPNCAAEYRKLRSDAFIMNRIRETILAKTDTEITDGEHVAIEINIGELWFTQTHFAEIRELMRLKDDVKRNAKPSNMRMKSTKATQQSEAVQPALPPRVLQTGAAGVLQLPLDAGISRPAPTAQSVTKKADAGPRISEYNSYIGKTIRRKDGFVGKVENIFVGESDVYLDVKTIKGREAGTNTKIQLSFIVKNRGVYSIENEEKIP